MNTQQEINVSFYTSENDLSIIATAEYPNGQPVSPYSLFAHVTRPNQFPLAQSLIHYIFLTAHNSNVEITADLSVQYGFWIVKLQAGNNQRLEIHELDEQNQFVPGIQRAILYWETQLALCHKHQLTFQPVSLQQTAIAHPNIFDQTQSVMGFRNVRRKDLSGWVIITREEDVWDEENTQVMYLYDVVRQRPDLIRFFGLPYDTAFYLGQEGYQVWVLDDE